MAKYDSLKIRATAALILSLLLPLKPALAQQPQPLKLGIYPYLASTELVRRFTPLAEYLSRVMKRPVTIELSNSYNTHIQKIANDMLHIAFLGPASYVIMTDQYGKKPILAGFESNGKRTFHGVIVKKRGSPIRSLRDLKGKKFAFGDRHSTMSHLLPKYMLLMQGVEAKDLATSMHLTNLDNIALSILAGSFDAGAVKNEVFLKYQSEGLEALVFTPEINDHLFVANALLPKQTVLALRRALLDLKHDKDGKAILSAMRADVTALVAVDDSEFDNLREIIKELKRAGVRL